jgi:hypothetical protein
MKIKSAIATLGAALILAGAPALASAADAQTGPIHINNIRVSGGGFTSDENVLDPASAEISFTNQYGSPATDVMFAVYSQGVELAQYDDRGSFAQNIAINHMFPESRALGDQSAAVVKATFADGTTWQNPEIAQAQPTDTTGILASYNR